MVRVGQTQPASPYDDGVQDYLLMAGSKISFKDLYQQEIGLPLYRQKYHKQEDVEDLFVLINGVLTDVSRNAYMTHKSLTEARKESENAAAVAEDAIAQVESLTTQISGLESERGRLLGQINQLIEKVNSAPSQSEIEEILEYSTQMESEIVRLRSELETVKQQSTANTEVDRLRATLAQMKSRNTELSNANDRLIDANRNVDVAMNNLRLTYDSTQSELDRVSNSYADALKTISNKDAEIADLRSKLVRASQVIVKLQNK